MQPAYYAILPANVRYDKNLKPMEKIMYAEITALANKDGFCSASNSYFANLYEKSNETISRWISKLEKEGYVKVVIDKENGNRRKIYPIDKKINSIDENDNRVLTKKSIPIDEKIKQNNINTILQEDNNIKKEKIDKKEKNFFEEAKADIRVQTLLNDLGVDEYFLNDLLIYREQIDSPLKTIQGVIGLLKKFLEAKTIAKVNPIEAFEEMAENEYKSPQWLVKKAREEKKRAYKKEESDAVNVSGLSARNAEVVKRAIERRRQQRGGLR